jgi:cytochrome c oxidase assembly protein subunit 11
MSKTKIRNHRVVVVLLVIVVGMFGFGFVLIPIYRMMANIYGFGGEMHADESGRGEAQNLFKQVVKKGVDKSRTVTLQFMVTGNTAMNLEFRPLMNQVKVNPGEVKEVSFFVKNLSGRKMVLQAIPTVSPDSASKFLARNECICFTRQVLKPGESKAMPVKVAIDPDMPRNIQVLTLSYRFIEKRQTVDISDEMSVRKQVASFVAPTTGLI